jgi:hypothetical protein
MARLIQAFSTYCPRIDLLKAAAPRRFMDLITRRTTLSAGVVKNVQESEVETLIDLLTEGRPVHTGVAIFTPSIDRHGKLSVKVRVDKRIVAALNAPGAFKGKVDNNKNIGMSTAEFIQLWNEEHPQDLIVLDASSELAS